MIKSRIKFNKSRRTKVVEKIELISHCDNCGLPLGRTCQRDANSSVCAEGFGIFTKNINGKWMFFCNESCGNNHK